MVGIKLANVAVEFPVTGGANSSIRGRLFRVASKDKSQSVSLTLNGVDIEVVDGERVIVLGQNGSGKSTLLKVLAGLLRPTRGSVELQGEAVALLNLDMGLSDEATGEQNVFLLGRVLGLSKSRVKATIHEIELFSGLGESFYRPVRAYSSGMRLRLSFSAISHLILPEVLIMDEWLSVGDHEFRSRAQERLTGLAMASKIMVLATHERDIAESFGTRGIVLERGEVVFDGEIAGACRYYFEQD